MFPTFCGTRCRGKRGMSPRIIPHPSHLPESHKHMGPIVRLPGCLQAAGRFGLGVQSWFLSAAPAASPKIQNQWGPMGSHGFPWGPMGSHGVPMGPHGSHGVPWDPHVVPMGPPWPPWKIQEFRKSSILMKTTIP